jgi:hypothetical protein
MRKIFRARDVEGKWVNERLCLKETNFAAEGLRSIAVTGIGVKGVIARGFLGPDLGFYDEFGPLGHLRKGSIREVGGYPPGNQREDRDPIPGLSLGRRQNVPCQNNASYTYLTAL